MSSPRPRFLRFPPLGRWLRKPLVLGVSSGVLVSLGGAYAGFQYWAYDHLSPWLSAELSRQLQRPVTIGPVQDFYFTQVRFGPSQLPATAQDPTSLSLSNLTLVLNPWSLLLGQPLALEAKASQPLLTLQQNAAGKWSSFQLPEGQGPLRLPSDIAAQFQLQGGQIKLLPHGTTKALTLQLEGRGQYQYKKYNQAQSIDYNLAVGLSTSRVQVKGQTQLDTGQSQVALSLERLNLVELVGLFPGFPGQLQQGSVQGQARINLPSWQQVPEADIQGNVRLEQLQAQWQGLKTPLRANLQLSFTGQNLVIRQGQLALGPLKTALQGTVDWHKGYALAFQTEHIDTQALLKTLRLVSPLPLTGSLKAQWQVTGPLDNPQVQGRLSNVRPLRLDKVSIAALGAEFRGNLDQLELSQLQIRPTTGGALQAQGQVQWQLRPLLSGQAWRWQTLPLALQWQGELVSQKLLQLYQVLAEDIQIGNLQTRGNLSGTLGRPLARLDWQTTTPNRWQDLSLALAGRAHLEGQTLRLTQARLQTQGGELQLTGLGDWSRNQWQTQIQANQLALAPFLPWLCRSLTCPEALTQRPLTLQQANLRLTGPLQNWRPETWQGSGQLQIRREAERLALQAELKQGELNTALALENWQLQPFLRQLPPALRLAQATVNLQGRLVDYQRLNWAGLTGQTQMAVSLAGDQINLQGDIAQGQLRGQAQMGRLNLQALAPALTVPVQLQGGQIQFTAPLADLLQTQPQLQGIRATADLRFRLGDGTILSKTQLTAQGWQSRLTAQRVNLQSLFPEQALALDPLSAQVHLAGTFPPDWGQSLALQVKTAQLTFGPERLQAQGHLTLVNLLAQPQLARVKLRLQSQTNLAKLPVHRWLQDLPLAPSLRPESPSIAGMARFEGQLTGQNIRDWRDLQLQGRVDLANLAVNQRAFEPTLQGTLASNRSQPLSLKLKGQEDIIALDLSPCPRESCLVPLLPTRFNLRQTYQTASPLALEGYQNGDYLRVNVRQFPLTALNLQPGRRYNIAGTLTGQAEAQLSLNLQHGTGQGHLRIEQLGLGGLKADHLNAQVAFRNQVLSFDNTVLQLGQSRYNLRASLDLKTQSLQGNLQISQGKVNELLKALRISDVDSLLRLLQWQTPPDNVATSLAPLTVGNADYPLEHQLNLLYLIDQKIRLLAQQYEQGGLPRELNINGLFDADLSLSGNLQSPQLDLRLQGQRWSWYPQPAFANIVPPLGLVLNNRRFLPIHRVDLQARFQNGVMTVQPSFIDIRDARLALEGNFSAKQNAAVWSVNNFSLDTLGIFMPLPSEVAGKLNAQGSIIGTLNKPQIRGLFSVDEPALNARPLRRSLAGNFNFTQGRIQVATDGQAPLSLYANIPLVPQSKTKDTRTTKPFEVRLNLQSEAMQLLGALTQDQLVWLDGLGEINLNIQGELAINSHVQLSNFDARGQIRLDNARLKSAALDDPLLVSGLIDFDNETLAVEELVGIFDQSKISVRGQLPLFTAQPRLDNPLSISINKATLDLPTLYSGDLEGLMSVDGTLFKPRVSGYLQLANGQVLLPSQVFQPNNTAPGLPKTDWFRPQQSQPLILPELENLRLRMDNLFIEQNPLYSFAFGGNLRLNGPLTDPERIRPEGEIAIQRGRVSFLDTRFLLDRRNPNQIVFRPNQGLFNPNLNVAMRTIVSELPQSQRIRSADSNEIPDDSINKIQRIDIRLLLNGSLNQLLPKLNAQKARACRATPEFKPLPGVSSFSEYQLRNLSDCLNVLASQGFTDKQVFSNPAIRLTSSPPRSEGEIIRLLGEQVIVLVDAFQGKNSSQLIDVGITQLAIPMVFQGLVYDVETAISNTIYSTDFRIVPFLEAIYEVEKKGYVRFSYDYGVNEVRVRYEKQF